MQSCGKNFPRIEGHGAKKEVCLVHRFLDFHFFSKFVFVHGSKLCHLQCDSSNLNEKSLNFFEKFYKFHVVLSQDPHQQKESQLTYTYRFKDRI
jgi:hypothetical protein